MATIVQLPPQQPPLREPVAPWPLYDLCLDVPHPAASTSCPPAFLIASPVADPAVADELPKAVPQIARFAFPEYDEAAQQPDRQATLNKYDFYAMQAVSFQNFTFSMQLQSGARLYGHVRRYLPPHLVARTRHDVGRRGERALVILTRASGADHLYSSILKSVEAITSQQAALPRELQAHAEPKKWFLHSLFQYQQHLAKIYGSKPAQERGKPLIATLEGLEIGPLPRYKGVDTSRFIIPTCLLYRSSATDPSAGQSSSILPLLRCVGVAHALRIMAALLSERRVVIVSSSPTRLATCSHAALAMLAQGLLHWQHLYIPVLPTHLWQYLAAPYPYLIGILSANATRLDRTDGLGDVLIIHLDSNTMETRGMSPADIAEHLPDLFQPHDSSVPPVPGMTGKAGSSASEFLGQDLVELLKVDKRTLYGESTFQNMGETAAKATKAIKGGFLKLRDKGRQLLLQQQQRSSGNGSEEELQNDAVGEAPNEGNSMAADYIYTEGCHNELGEEEARIAFTSFFLGLLGNMRWYLTAKPGEPPKLDREKFLMERRSMGEGDGTTMWPLLKNFCQSQMLEEFAKARIEEVRARQPVTPDAPLFLQCANYHRHHSIDFGLISVRRVARQVAEGSPSRVTGMLQTNARRMAMTLTSNKAYEGDYSKAIAQLVEQCRECSSVLFDVMSVIWLRIRDSKGMKWKHAYQALQILKNLLYHGPMAVISEATDGLDKIRAMKYYDNMRSQSIQQVRTAAQTVYNLLVDRAKLFSIRRACADRRQQLQDPNQRMPTRDTRLTVTLSFRSIHLALHPNAGPTIARIPSAAPTQASRVMQREPMADLLSGAPLQQSAVQQQASSDMLGLFDSMAVSQSSAATPPAPVAPQANAYAVPAPQPTGGATPAQLYPYQVGQVQQRLAQAPTQSHYQSGPPQQPHSQVQYGQPQQTSAHHPPHGAAPLYSVRPAQEQHGYPQQAQPQYPPQSQQQYHPNQPGSYQQQQQQQQPSYQQPPGPKLGGNPFDPFA